MVTYPSLILLSTKGGFEHMKKVAAVLAVVVLVVSLVSLAFAADAKKATIKGVDAKAGTIVYTGEDGKDMTMNVDKSVDLGKVKAGDKVMITVEKDTVMSVKAAKAKAAVGC
jgi:Cu/Ag efflux protein CusF